MEKKVEQYIQLRKEISDIEYTKIKELEECCIKEEEINLKLEVEYKLNTKKKHSNPLKEVNEFFYYVGDTLIGYLGVSSFGRNTAEITGMVHPKWRRKGIFTRLYEFAKGECSRREFEKILLLCDNNSAAGKGFIQSNDVEYAFSEYKMVLPEDNRGMTGSRILLKKAKNYDGEIIAKLDSIFFGEPNIQLTYPEEEELKGCTTYLIEFSGVIIGKIRIEYNDGNPYIYGFGIMPEYRGKGLGKEALNTALHIIRGKSIQKVYLDVEAKNEVALQLYKSCGFQKESVMNYYKVK